MIITKESLSQLVREEGSVAAAMRKIGYSRQYYYVILEQLTHVAQVELIKDVTIVKEKTKKRPRERKINLDQRKIKNCHELIEWFEQNPNYLYSKFFLDRLKINPRKPDLATIEKLFTTLNYIETNNNK